MQLSVDDEGHLRFDGQQLTTEKTKLPVTIVGKIAPLQVNFGSCLLPEAVLLLQLPQVVHSFFGSF